MEYVLIALRGMLVVVFVVSAASKLRGRRAFTEFVTATGRLLPWRAPASVTRPLAVGVVCTEVAVVALVLVPATVPIGFAAATGLLLAFTLAIVVALRRGNRAPCRCFGTAEQPLGLAHVIRNVALLTAATAGLAGSIWTSATPDLAGALVAAASGVVMALPVILADDIASLFRPMDRPPAGVAERSSRSSGRNPEEQPQSPPAGAKR